MLRAPRHTEGLLVAIIAAFVAAMSHVVLSALPNAAEGSYRHVAVFPLFSLGLAGIGVFAITMVFHSLTARSRRSAIAAVAKRLLELPWVSLCAATSFIAVGVFALGEFAEQLISLGQPAAIALGFGTAIFFIVVALCSIVASVCVRAFLSAVLAALTTVIAWLTPLHVARALQARIIRRAARVVRLLQLLTSLSSRRRGPPLARVST